MIPIPGEKEVINGLHHGHEGHIRALFAMYYRALCYFSERIIHQKPESEDIAVETFLKLLDKKKDFDNLADIKAFLFISARNACIDFLRKEKRKNGLSRELEILSATNELTYEQEMIIARVLQTVYAEVENLPGQCRTVFKSFFIEGKSTAIIASEMGISPQTVLNQKSKAIKVLRLSLLDEGFYSIGTFLIALSLFSRL